MEQTTETLIALWKWGSNHGLAHIGTRCNGGLGFNYVGGGFYISALP